MRRREFIMLLGGATVARPLSVRAQQPAMPVIGYLGIGSRDTEVPLAAFRQGLSEAGLVANLARPGGNVTGFSVTLDDLIGKWLELLKEAVPGASRVALLLKPDAMPDRVREVRLREADASARALGMELQVFEVRGREDFDGVFSDMSKARVGALVVWPTPVFQLERRRLADLAAEHRLPAVFQLRIHVEAGGLMSYGPNLADLNRRAAIYVGKILKGTKPSDLPVEQPTKFELVINLKTAKSLGIAVPASLLARADEVVE